MKKLFAILVFALAIVVNVNAQVRVCDLGNYKDDIFVYNADPTAKYSCSYSYEGNVEDTLSVNQDTLQIYVNTNKFVPTNYYSRTVLSPISGADTTVTINVYGKIAAGDTYTLIETDSTAAITASVATIVESITDADYTYSIPAFSAKQDTATFATYPADSIKFPAITVTPVPSIKPYYRYLMFEYIIKGNHSVGVGIKLDSFELVIQEAK
jgi:hypothetical protein